MSETAPETRYYNVKVHAQANITHVAPAFAKEFNKAIELLVIGAKDGMIAREDVQNILPQIEGNHRLSVVEYITEVFDALDAAANTAQVVELKAPESAES